MVMFKKETVGLTSTPLFCTSPHEGHTISCIDTECKSCAAEWSTINRISRDPGLRYELKFQPEGGSGGKLMECPKRKLFISFRTQICSVNVVAIWSLYLDISFMKAEILAPRWCCWVSEIIRNGGSAYPLQIS